VLADGLKLLFALWRRPAAGMGAILDRGSALFALLAALAASWLLGAMAPLRLGILAPVIVLAVAYVPGTLIAGALLGRLGSLGTVFQRDYSPLLTCAAMAWTAAIVPLALVAWVVPEEAMPWIAAAAGLYFATLMFFAVRTLFGLGNGAAAVTVAASWLSLVLAALIWPAIRYLTGWLASPFVLLYAWYFLGGELSSRARDCAGGRATRECSKPRP